jgi:hypothetical protein
VRNFIEVGSFEEFVSRQFTTVIVSFCKTKNVVKQGGPLLNNAGIIEFLKKRAKKQIVIFGKAKSLNPIWKNEFYEKARTQGSVTEVEN